MTKKTADQKKGNISTNLKKSKLMNISEDITEYIKWNGKLVFNSAGYKVDMRKNTVDAILDLLNKEKSTKNKIIKEYELGISEAIKELKVIIRIANEELVKLNEPLNKNMKNKMQEMVQEMEKTIETLKETKPIFKELMMEAVKQKSAAKRDNSGEDEPVQRREKSPRDNLKAMLEDYIQRIDNTNVRGKYRAGFEFFAKSRGVNRNMNYLLAKALLNDLNENPEKPLNQIFENLSEKRRNLTPDDISASKKKMIKKRIWSSELNNIIKEANKRVFAAPDFFDMAGPRLPPAEKNAGKKKKL